MIKYKKDNPLAVHPFQEEKQEVDLFSSKPPDKFQEALIAYKKLKYSTNLVDLKIVHLIDPNLKRLFDNIDSD